MVFWSRVIFFSNEKPIRLSENSAGLFPWSMLSSAKNCPAPSFESCARSAVATVRKTIRPQTIFAVSLRTCLDSFPSELAPNRGGCTDRRQRCHRLHQCLPLLVRSSRLLRHNDHIALAQSSI